MTIEYSIANDKEAVELELLGPVSTFSKERDEFYAYLNKDGSVKLSVRSPGEEHFSGIDLSPEAVKLLAAFIMPVDPPLAYMIREVRNSGRVKMHTDRAFVTEEKAQNAALRLTSAFRTCHAVAVYGASPWTAFGVFKPGMKGEV